MNKDPDFDDEAELQEWLQSQFRYHGWAAQREVSPRRSNVRADLLVTHESWGTIGIECKYLSSNRNGKKIGEAIEQILWKYRGRRYNGDRRVDLWAVCPYIKKRYDGTRGNRQTIREILCHLGIGIIWPYTPIKIDFAYSSSETKIQLGDESGTRYGDRERIEKMVEKKQGSHEPVREDHCQYSGSVKGCTAPVEDVIEINNYEVRLCKHHLREIEKRPKDHTAAGAVR